MGKEYFKVSVIIPTFKRDVKYLFRAISSILNQTYDNCEIVVVDDNDPTSPYRIANNQIMKQFCNNSNIIYIKNSANIGGSEARNIGILHASGDYITFLDDDDEYLSNKVKNQLFFMIKHNCDMSFTNLKLFNEIGNLIDYREYTSIKSYEKTYLLKYHIMHHITGTPTFMFRAEALRRINGFENVSMGQEFYLMLKAVESNLKICYLNDCNVIAYRHKLGGISQGLNKIHGENSLFKFKEKYFHLFNKKEIKYIKFRHQAVMLIAYKRNKQYKNFAYSFFRMIFLSPINVITEGLKYFKHIILYKQ